MNPKKSAVNQSFLIFLIIFNALCIILYVSSPRFDRDGRIILTYNELLNTNFKFIDNQYLLITKLPMEKTNSFMKKSLSQINIYKIDSYRDISEKPQQQKNRMLIISMMSSEQQSQTVPLLQQLDLDPSFYANNEVYLLRLPGLMHVDYRNLYLIYFNQINHAITFLTYKFSKNLTIMAFEYTAFMTFSYFAKNDFDSEFRLACAQLQRIILFNTIDPNINIYESSSVLQLNELKIKITNDSARLNLFNQLPFIFISTLPHSQQSQLPQNSLKFQSKDGIRTLSNSVELYTSDIAEINQSISPDFYLNYLPLIRILTGFLKDDSYYRYNKKQVEYYWRFGEKTNSMVQLKKEKCVNYTIDVSKKENVRFMVFSCIKLKIINCLQTHAIAVVSNSSFQMYSQINFNQIQPTERNHAAYYFLFSKTNEPTYLISSIKQQIFSVQCVKIYSPKNPLPFAPSQIIKMKSISLPMVYAVQMCDGSVKIFPNAFNSKLTSRIKMLDTSDSDCYSLLSFFQEIIERFLFTISKIKNIFFLSLFYSFASKKRTIERPFEHLLLMCFLYMESIQPTDLLMDSLICLFSMGIIIGIQKMLALFQSACSYFDVDSLKVAICMLLITVLSVLKELLPDYSWSTWRLFLLVMLAVISPSNVYFLAIRLYFLRDEIILQINQPIELVFLMKFMYITKYGQQQQESSILLSAKTWLNRVFLFLMALVVRQQGMLVDSLTSAYMKIICIITVFK